MPPIDFAPSEHNGLKTPRPLELLAPAANKDIAHQAILHGADAVYIGGPSHGARKKASNSIEDIASLVEFAHQFRARVYVTLNTLVYDNELEQVAHLAWDLYRVGVDALIVQDMALLELNLPPVQLHASTQCDIRTPEKARFLEECGFSQLVVARELSLAEIRQVVKSVTVPVECFIHGALCVCYSGRCGASFMTTGRSANRGECSQVCRLPFTLRNGRGEAIGSPAHFLSLRDFNATHQLDELVDAGVSSFKIEGRLKDEAYVKNITAWYRLQLDRIIEANPGKYRRASAGEVELAFTPDPVKSFNRGFTEYFLKGRKNHRQMASLKTPKSLGEPISSVKELNNGDGIGFFNSKGEYEGALVNGISGSRIIASRDLHIPVGTRIFRTFDVRWQKTMARETAKRRIPVDVHLDETGVTATDVRGVSVRIPLEVKIEESRTLQNRKPVFEKLGNTVYKLRGFEDTLSPDVYIPVSMLASLRRRLADALDSAASATYPLARRGEGNDDCRCPFPLDSRSNVANKLAESFYRRHGCHTVPDSLETARPSGETEVMTTRYCLRRELGCCLKDTTRKQRVKDRFVPPLTLESGNRTFRLDFDCARCEMKCVLIK